MNNSNKITPKVSNLFHFNTFFFHITELMVQIYQHSSSNFNFKFQLSKIREYCKSIEIIIFFEILVEDSKLIYQGSNLLAMYSSSSLVATVCAFHQASRASFFSFHPPHPFFFFALFPATFLLPFVSLRNKLSLAIDSLSPPTAHPRGRMQTRP